MYEFFYILYLIYIFLNKQFKTIQNNSKQFIQTSMPGLPAKSF